MPTIYEATLLMHLEKGPVIEMMKVQASLAVSRTVGGQSGGVESVGVASFLHSLKKNLL